MNFSLLHPADQLVMIMERIYGYGMTTTSGGNLSILDENGDIWITPGSVDKGSLTRKDIIQVKADGSIVGIHKPSVELPVHKQIYNKRSDIKAILHAHPPALVSFSIARKIPETMLIPNIHHVCGKVAMALYDIPGSKGLSDKISDKFSEGFNTVMLENHGIFVGSVDLFRAFMAFETLDFCARIEIDARNIGNLKILSEKHVALSNEKQNVKLEEFVNKSYSSEELAARRDMCNLIHRSYNQQLFTSTQGTFSQRLSDNSFLITPYMKDRKYLDEGDIVRIVDGRCEAGKIPSRSVILHKKIYENNPDISSVIIAHPPYIMAFAVTDAEFDSRTIPESYIMLRNVKKIPFGSSFMQPDLVSHEFNNMTHVLLVDNDCLIVTGTSLLNAFDKLEVAEFSAKAIVLSSKLGPIISISESEVADLQKSFNMV